jgi:hypothetical protein
MNQTSDLLCRVLVILGIMTNLAFADSRIHGYVVDSESREPLIGANIQVLNERAGASTNLDGYFVIPTLKPGLHNLRASYQGYQPLDTLTALIDGQNNLIEIKLKQTSIRLKEVVVSAEKGTQELQKLEVYAGNIRINPTLINITPPLIERDVLRSFQSIPGVLPSNDFSSDLNVRGSSADETMIMIDGVEVYNPNHMGGLFSAFIPSTVKHADLKRSSYPAEYGGRLGGVLHVSSTEGNREKLATEISLGVLSSSAKVSAPVPIMNNTSVMLAGRRTYLDVATRLMGDEIPYYFYDFLGRGNWDPQPNDRVSVTGYWGDDTFESGSIDFSYGNRAANANWRHIWNASLYSRFIMAFSRYRSHFDFGGKEGLVETNHLNDWSSTFLMEYHKDSKLYIEGGIFLKNISTKYDFWANNFHYTSVEQKMGELSFYAKARWRPHPLLIIEPGLRVANYGTETLQDKDAEYFLRLEPRLGIKYILTEYSRLKVAWGVYNQAMQKYKRDGSSFSAVWTVADTTSTPAHAIHWTGGIEFDLNEGTVMEIEGYYKNMNNVREGQIIEQDPNRRELLASELFYFGSGEAFGLDISLNRTIGRWTGMLGYSASWAIRVFDEVNSGEPYYSAWDKRHNFNAVVNRKFTYKTLKGFPFNVKFLRFFRYNESSLTMTTRLASSPRYTEPWKAYYLGDDGLNLDESSLHTYKNKNSSELDMYKRVDLVYSMIHQKENSSFEFRIGVLNIFDSSNYWGVSFDYNVEENGGMPVKEYVDGMGRIPSIEMIWSF